jgi:succinate dehydrogenase flavin-adding protein (antitoxin of CptAB toxin-antitoxin module)
MMTYKELNEQNHRITELSHVLRYLLKDRSMCDTGSCCNLFNNYVDQVKQHIEHVDKNMYSDLLASPDEKVNNVAKNFMSGSVEVKKILQKFTKKWCPSHSGTELKIKDHQKFLDETDELFDIVLQRILDETEHLYPLVRSLK